MQYSKVPKHKFWYKYQIALSHTLNIITEIWCRGIVCRRGGGRGGGLKSWGMGSSLLHCESFSSDCPQGTRPAGPWWRCPRSGTGSPCCCWGPSAAGRDKPNTHKLKTDVITGKEGVQPWPTLISAMMKSVWLWRLRCMYYSNNHYRHLSSWQLRLILFKQPLTI